MNVPISCASEQHVAEFETIERQVCRCVSLNTNERKLAKYKNQNARIESWCGERKEAEGSFCQRPDCVVAAVDTLWMADFALEAEERHLKQVSPRWTLHWMSAKHDRGGKHAKIPAVSFQVVITMKRVTANRHTHRIAECRSIGQCLCRRYRTRFNLKSVATMTTFACFEW